MKLLITDDVERSAGDRIRAVAPEAEHVLLRAGGADAAVDDVRVAFLSEAAGAEVVYTLFDVLPACEQLEWLHSGAVGVDIPVFQDLLARGVRITTSSGANASLIAQSAILHVLAHSRGLAQWKDAQRRHAWEPHQVEDLEGKVLGVLGLGPIGTCTATLGSALGMRVVGLRRTPRGDEPCECWALTRIDDLISIVDYLVLALPSTPETRRILNAERIGALKPSAYVVNVARGALIDETALAEALATQAIAGAALDVFDVEPLPAASPLWDLPNVTVTPHACGRNPIKGIRATSLFVDNLVRFLNHQPLINEVESQPRS